MADIEIYDEDDKFLSNAIIEDEEADKLDKTKYVKPVTAYIEINSLARNQSHSSHSIFPEYQSLTSTGAHYTSFFSFYPFSLDKLPNELNVFIKFRLMHAHTYSAGSEQCDDGNIINSVINSEDESDVTIFDVIIPKANTENMAYFADEIKCQLNAVINSRAKSQLVKYDENDHHRGHGDHVFDVSAYIDSVINPDRVSITISCISDYMFVLSFIDPEDVKTEKTYPNPNNYSVNLDRIYNNVKEIAILDADIPFSDTIINSWNNTIEFSFTIEDEDIFDPETGELIWIYYIPIGNYTIDQFIQEFENGINMYIMSKTEITDQIFNICLVPNSGQITISSHHLFQFHMVSDKKYSPRNLYQMLGYQVDKTNGYTHTFTNAIIINTGRHIYYKPYSSINFAVSNYIWIKLNNYETIFDTKTSKYYFTKFPINQILPTSQEFSLATIRQLYQLDVQLYDPVGVLYNTNMSNHRFTLAITYYLDLLQGTEYSSRRGTGNVI